MDFMGTKEASKQWDIPQATVARLCRENKIAGAEQDTKGSPWRIPINTAKPQYKTKNNFKP